MRNSLYDALEVTSSSSTPSIKAAIRTVVRRFWSVPRDASGDSEEAVRFAAMAASILVDPVRRKDYDAALNPGVGAGPWRLPIANRDASNDGHTDSRVLAEQEGGASQLSIVGAPPSALPGVNALARALPDGSAWASPVVPFLPGVAWLMLWYALVAPFSAWIELPILKALAVSFAALALALTMAAWICRPQAASVAAASLSRLAIIKWRREGSIFLGAPPPQHDIAWIFKLRLMELTRSAAGFVTSVSPWRRLAARLVDYALLAMAIYFGVVLIDLVVPILESGFILARSPLVLPTVVVLSAVPIAAFMHRWWGTTPGKWLLSLQVVSGVTRPADHADPTDRVLLWSRAFRVAWRGAALGVWPIALLMLPRNMRLARDTETDWEAAGDSVVMARPLTTSAVATAMLLLLASTLMLLGGWRSDWVKISPQVASLTETSRTAARSLFAPPTPVADAAPSVDVATNPAVNGPSKTSFVDTVREKLGLSRAPSAEAGSMNAPSIPANAATATPPVNSANRVGTAPPSSADAELNKQASASLARRQRIEAYARQAETARRSGNYSGLQGACERWTQDQPGNGEAWRCLGLAHYQSGDAKQALPALRQALKLEPNDPPVERAILNILRP
jgi:tetratricopeptide (TPR) repeat protein